MDASMDELEELRNALESDMARIRMQIEEAKTRVIERGEYSDGDWFRRANYALRQKGREHQNVLREIGRLNRERRASQATTFEKAFIDAAKRRLDKAVFADLAGEAHDAVRDEAARRFNS